LTFTWIGSAYRYHATTQGTRSGSEPLLSRHPLVTSKLPRMLKLQSPLHSPQFMPRESGPITANAHCPPLPRDRAHRYVVDWRSVFKCPFLAALAASLESSDAMAIANWQYSLKRPRRFPATTCHNVGTLFWPIETRSPCHFRSHSFQSPPRIFHEPSPGLLERPNLACTRANRKEAFQLAQQ
jgi:hypothetical protein